MEGIIEALSAPADGMKPLEFSSEFSQNFLMQFKACLRKQSLIYWRSPEYNVVRLFFTAIAAVIFGSIFWNVGMKRYIFILGLFQFSVHFKFTFLT